MSREAEKYEADDNRDKERVSAMNRLESYAFSAKSTIGSKAKKRAKVISQRQEVIQWLDDNQTAN